MSTDIYEKNGIQATVFAGRQRSDGSDRRMIQISGSEGDGDGYIQVYPSTLTEIVKAWRAYTGTEDKRDDKGITTGLALIIDRVEALRVRIDSTDEDEEIQFNKEHWLALCREALSEAVKYRHAWDVITANLALALDENPDTVAAAVRTCVRDNRDKDEQIAAMAACPLPSAALAVTPDLFLPHAELDPEIRLLHAVMRLPPDARRRIVEYAASRSK